MDWIRLSKRMAIYLRDGFDCIWCRGVFPILEDGYGLTLDHVYVDGCNEHYNLVTCCLRCNSSRRRTPLDVWLTRVSERTGEHERDIAHRVLSALGRALDMDVGRRLAKARRPSTAVAAE
jgi:hypothetical protein